MFLLGTTYRCKLGFNQLPKCRCFGNIKDLIKHIYMECVEKDLIIAAQTSGIIQNLKMEISKFTSYLQKHIISHADMVTLGYPVEQPDGVYIYKMPVNGNKDTKSEHYVYQRIIYNDPFNPYNSSWGNAVRHICNRCRKPFDVLDNQVILNQQCFYHCEKINYRGPAGPKYICCGGGLESIGCTFNSAHVWSGLEPGVNGPLKGYVKTQPSLSSPKDGNYGVYAVDCEMSYTIDGLELTRVSVTDTNRILVYDSYVRPQNIVLDFNTRYSGVSEYHMQQANSLKQVQMDLLNIFNDKTILIGHGLENDLRALKLLHTRVVDTAYSFPHYKGLPFRNSLKNLADTLLQVDMRKDVIGHCSFEDANIAMDLMIWRAMREIVC